MTNQEINRYAQSLFDRINEAVMLKRAEIKGGDWEPHANNCHHNVSIWCEHNGEFEPVSGWFYFDLPGLNYVKFVAHSAVRTPEKELFDITPSNASQDYPFISGRLGEEEYASLVESIENGEINYVPQNS